MSSGMKGISSVFLFLAACGSVSRAYEYRIDVKNQMLRGPKPKYDKPLSYCETNVCLAFEDADVKAIKKYISELELRLKECKGK